VSTTLIRSGGTPCARADSLVTDRTRLCSVGQLQPVDNASSITGGNALPVFEAEPS
jgi:hypothetical protein